MPFLKPIDDSEAARDKTLVARWGRFVTRNAKPVFIVVLVGIRARLDLRARPARRVRPGHAARGADGPAGLRPGREGFGPGFNGPIPIVVDVNGDDEAPQRIYEAVQDLDGVASAGEPQLNDEETVAIVFVTPDSAPQDEATDELVDRRARRSCRPRPRRGDAIAYVSGLTAAFKDIGERIMERLPLFLLYVIGVTFILLAMAFRSIVISLTAGVTTILSAFAGFGVLTLVVQEGHLLGLTGSTGRGRSRPSCRRSRSRSSSASRWTTWSS